MNKLDFIQANIGNLVYLVHINTLAEFKPLVANKTPLRLIELTKGGLAKVHDESANKYYKVSPSYVREYYKNKEG